MLVSFDSEQEPFKPAPIKLPVAGWFHVEKPTDEDLGRLRAAGFPSTLLAHALDENELARIDHTAGCTLVVLRVPCAGDPDDTIPFRTTSLALLRKDRLVVTVSCRPSEVIADVLRARDPDVSSVERLLPRLLQETAERFLRLVQEIEKCVEQLEEELQVSQRNREVVGLLRYQKALVHFTTALASDAIMLERLARDAHDNLSNLDRDLMDDVTVEFRQAIEMTKIQEEILSQMMDAFASIISNNLNVVVKVLTALTIVLTIPTMVASFYGMNVNLPGQHHPAAFLGTVLISLLGAAILALWFWRKRWL